MGMDSMESLFARLRSFDAYPKLNEEFKVRTLSGALVTTFSLLLIVVLLVNEFTLYWSAQREDHLFVDVSRDTKLTIHFDMAYHHIPCSLLSLDAMDVAGAHQLGVSSSVKKRPLDSSGRPLPGEEMPFSVSEGSGRDQRESSRASIVDVTRDPLYCGPCYGAESEAIKCCRTCEEVKAQYRTRNWAIPPLSTIEQCVAQGQLTDPSLSELDQHQGCQIYGFLEVNKVAGNFHFAPGRSFQHQHMHVHDLAQFTSTRFNVSHTIHSLTFGDSYPGQVHPLDNVSKVQPSLDEKLLQQTAMDSGGMFMYYIKIVPTTYSYLHSFSQLVTNQYSVTEHYRLTSAKDGQGLPGVFFFYELSPIMVKISERRMGLLHFVTQMCAILGGVLTVAGIIDRLIYSSMKSFEKKLTLNKVS